jgi:hypothetical protein
MTILDADIDVFAGGSAELDPLASRFAPHTQPPDGRPVAVEKLLSR